MRPSESYAPRLSALQRQILTLCRTDQPLTGTQIAQALGKPGHRVGYALVDLVRQGRLQRPAKRHGYLLVRCRGV